MWNDGVPWNLRPLSGQEARQAAPVRGGAGQVPAVQRLDGLGGDAMPVLRASAAEAPAAGAQAGVPMMLGLGDARLSAVVPEELEVMYRAVL